MKKPQSELPNDSQNDTALSFIHRGCVLQTFVLDLSTLVSKIKPHCDQYYSYLKSTCISCWLI